MNKDKVNAHLVYLGTTMLVLCLAPIITGLQDRRSCSIDGLCNNELDESRFYSDRRVDRLDQDQEQRLLLFNRNTERDSKNVERRDLDRTTERSSNARDERRELTERLYDGRAEDERHDSRRTEETMQRHVDRRERESNRITGDRRDRYDETDRRERESNRITGDRRDRYDETDRRERESNRITGDRRDRYDETRIRQESQLERTEVRINDKRLNSERSRESSDVDRRVSSELDRRERIGSERLDNTDDQTQNRNERRESVGRDGLTGSRNRVEERRIREERREQVDLRTDRMADERQRTAETQSREDRTEVRSERDERMDRATSAERVVTDRREDRNLETRFERRERSEDNRMDQRRSSEDRRERTTRHEEHEGQRYRTERLIPEELFNKDNKSASLLWNMVQGVLFAFIGLQLMNKNEKSGDWKSSKLTSLMSFADSGITSQ